MRMRFFGVVCTLLFFSITARAGIVRQSCPTDIAAARIAGPYDFIVVGTGAGGGIVASRLAQRGEKVLAIEAGGYALPVESTVPVLHAVASEVPAVALDYGVQHFADPMRARLDPKYDFDLPGILYPRGEGIGGSTIVNALIAMLAQRGDFDGIAKITNDPGWSDEAMQWYWQNRVERNRTRPLARGLHRLGQFFGLTGLQNFGGHGFDGWLPTSRPGLGTVAKILTQDPQLRSVVLAAERVMRGRVGLRSHLRHALSGFDPNDRGFIDRGDEGLTVIPFAADENGRRSGVRSLIMKTIKHYGGNFDIMTDTIANRIIFDGNRRATGVEIGIGSNPLGSDDEPGRIEKTMQVSARKGVVVAAGAFGTPQLMKLSGYGPQAELRQFGIPVVYDNEFMGEGLHDRYEVAVISEFDRPFNLLRNASLRADDSDPNYRQWRDHGTGLYQTNGAIIAMMIKSRPSLPSPDIIIFGTPGMFPGYYRGYAAAATEKKNVFTWLILKAKTVNRGGRVRLTSNDPRAKPDINFHYFQEGRDGQGRSLKDDNSDAAALAYAVEFVRQLNSEIKGIAREISPGPAIDTPDRIARWAEVTSWGHHATGTAAIGPVLNNRLTPHGLSNLWIPDASVFPDIPGHFIAVPTYLVGEKASDMIFEDGNQ